MTLLVNPTHDQKEVYSLALEVENLVIDTLKPGTTFKDVYRIALERVQEKSPQHLGSFVKNVGFGLGHEFKDPQQLLAEKSERGVKAGMVFCVSIGFLCGGDAPWAVWLCDTVVVVGEAGDASVADSTDPRGLAQVLTDDCSRSPALVQYELEDQTPEPERVQ